MQFKVLPEALGLYVSMQPASLQLVRNSKMTKCSANERFTQ